MWQANPPLSWQPYVEFLALVSVSLECDEFIADTGIGRRTPDVLQHRMARVSRWAAICR